MEKNVFSTCVFSVLLAFCFSVSGVDKMFVLKSDSFDNEAVMPFEFVHSAVKGGKDVSPALKWKGAPRGTKSFAIVCVDVHPIARRWIHWMVLNIPPDTTGLPAGASLKKMPPGSIELENSFGSKGYGGPNPPAGSGAHSYIFTVYALSVDKLEAPGDFVSENDFFKLVRGKVLGAARHVGSFELR